MDIKLHGSVGICKIDQDGNIAELQREFFGQGWIFKDWGAFKNRPDAPCYVPELSDTVYTAEDFLRVCNGQKEFAEQLFSGVDWQHPESLMEEWMRNNEWVECPNCSSLVNYGDGSNDRNCPACRVKVGEE